VTKALIGAGIIGLLATLWSEWSKWPQQGGLCHVARPRRRFGAQTVSGRLTQLDKTH